MIKNLNLKASGIITIVLISILITSCGTQKKLVQAIDKNKNIEQDLKKLKEENEKLKLTITDFEDVSKSYENQINELLGPQDEITPANEIILNYAEEMPRFNGEISLEKFFMTNVKYPQSAIDEGKTGVVYVQFVVESNGTLTEIKVVRPLQKDIDREAKRLIKKSETWIPGNIRGENVRVRMIIPISFEK